MRWVEELQTQSTLLSRTHFAEDVLNVFWSFKRDKTVSEEKTRNGLKRLQPGKRFGPVNSPFRHPRAVGDDLHLRHRPIMREDVVQVVLRHLEAARL